MTAVVDTTSRGRPLDEALSDTILDAALRVLARDGYGRFSMAAVAAEAGVHRPAIYRRWSDKTDLAVAAIERLRPAPVDRRSGDPRADLVAYLRDAVCGTDDEHRVSARLQQDLAVHGELADAVQRRLADPRRDALVAILRRGVDAGQLRADLDLDTAVDLLSGLMYARKRGALAPRDVTRFVDLALDGLRPR